MLDEIIYADLNEEEAKKVVEAYHKEAKAAGVMREREKRERSAGRDAPAAKRQRSQDKRHSRDDRGRSRDYQRGGDRGMRLPSFISVLRSANIAMSLGNIIAFISEMFFTEAKSVTQNIYYNMLRRNKVQFSRHSAEWLIYIHLKGASHSIA